MLVCSKIIKNHISQWMKEPVLVNLKCHRSSQTLIPTLHLGHWYLLPFLNPCFLSLHANKFLPGLSPPFHFPGIISKVMLLVTRFIIHLWFQLNHEILIIFTPKLLKAHFWYCQGHVITLPVLTKSSSIETYICVLHFLPYIPHLKLYWNIVTLSVQVSI